MVIGNLGRQELAAQKNRQVTGFQFLCWILGGKKFLYGDLEEADEKNPSLGTSPVVQWVRLHAPNAGGLGLVPGQGTRSHM